METIFLKTALCCMACDGEISEDEIKLLQSSSILSAINKDVLNDQISLFKIDGKKYLKEYIVLLSDNITTISTENKIVLLRIAVDMIRADGVVKYSEIKFFKLILSVLNISSQLVLEKIDGIDEDWVENDFSQSKDELSSSFFGNFQLSNTIDVNLNQFETTKEN